ncbi:MAG: O-antigen ligase family protein [bacterium]
MNWLVIVTGFVGVALFAVDLGPFTIFPYRICLSLLWLLFAMRVLATHSVPLPNYPTRWSLLFFGFWLVYAVLSLGWAASKGAGVRDVIFLFMGASLVFFATCYVRRESDFRMWHRIWIGMLCAFVLLGLWEHVTGQHLPVSGLFGETRARFMSRPTGVFFNPNDFATFLALGIPFGLSMLRYGRRMMPRLVGGVVAAAAFYLIVATGSRANMLAVLLEVSFLGLFLTRFKGKIGMLMAGGICASIFVLSAVGPIHSFFAAVGEELGSIYTQAHQESGSIAIRTNLARNSLLFLHSTAGFGVGAGNTEHWMAHVAAYDTAGILNAHNWWLEVLTEYGILVFAGYVALYVGVIRSLWRRWRSSPDRVHRMISEALLLSLVGFAVASMSSSSIMAFKPQWLLFAFAVSFVSYAHSGKVGGA